MSQSLQEHAIDQWTRELPVKAVRGNIVDANGVILAGNDTAYAVYVRPRCVTDFESVSRTLSDLFDMDCEALYEKLTTTKVSEITVKRQVDKKAVLELENHALDGVYYSLDNSRTYPYGNLLCQILGVCGGDGSGIYGIEKYYDKYLKGVDGKFLYEADLVGKDIDGKTPSYVAAEGGFTVKLNIDIEIQKIFEAVMEKARVTYTPKSASVVVVEPSTGKLLALATTPSFDLNDPPTDDMDTFNKLIRSPIIVDSYEPGSTFKTVTDRKSVV